MLSEAGEGSPGSIPGTAPPEGRTSGPDADLPAKAERIAEPGNGADPEALASSVLYPGAVRLGPAGAVAGPSPASSRDPDASSVALSSMPAPGLAAVSSQPGAAPALRSPSQAETLLSTVLSLLSTCSPSVSRQTVPGEDAGSRPRVPAIVVTAVAEFLRDALPIPVPVDMFTPIQMPPAACVNEPFFYRCQCPSPCSGEGFVSSPCNGCDHSRTSLPILDDPED
eukprot:gene4390-4650_t